MALEVVKDNMGNWFWVAEGIVLCVMLLLLLLSLVLDMGKIDIGGYK
jgi:hypothetical protein